MKSFILPLALSLALSHDNVDAKSDSMRLRKAKVETNVASTVGTLEETARELLNVGSGDYWGGYEMSMAPTKAPVAPQTPPPYASPTPAPQVPITPAPVETFPPITPSPTIHTQTVPPVATSAPVYYTAPPVYYTQPPVYTPTYVPGATTPPVQMPTLPPVMPPTSPPVAASVASRLQPYLIQGGNEFTDPTSYQSCALARVEQQVGVDSFTDAKLTQYYALYCIFCSTNGQANLITDTDSKFENVTVLPQWTVSTGWTDTATDPCSPWHGIVCVNDQVTELNLAENFLTGLWPVEIIMLASDGPRSTGAGALTKIDLFNNEYLFNNFDNSWMSLLGSNMTFLYFKETGFAGSLAPLPANILEFDCSYTLIDGGLTDATFAGLNKLNWAVLDGNAYNSTVPSVLGSLPELQYLYISDAFVFGDLSYMQGMPKIIEHWIDVNPGLGGTIPTFVGTLSTLESWSVTQANLNGPIPSELGNLSSLVNLWLYGNNLTGNIPSQLGLPPSLGVLQLEGNALIGSMPAEICQKRQFPGTLDTLGADCAEVACTQGACCTCCSLAECNPEIFG